MSTLIIVILVICTLLFVLLLLIICLFKVAEQTLGQISYNPLIAEDLERLKEIVKTSLPLMEILDKFYKDRGYYPRLLEQLCPDYIDDSFKSRFKISIISSSKRDRLSTEKLAIEDNLIDLVFIKEQPWYYSTKGRLQFFYLDAKLGWDASLYYSNVQKKWYFTPGNGSNNTELNFSRD